jgi:ribosomal protein L31E
MAKKETEPKITLERTYIIPLRRQWLKVPEYKRVNKAVKAIRQFLVRHMKIYDRDTGKIKVDILLNNELRFRGMRKPPSKIKVRAKKYDDGLVKVELANIPKVLQYKLDREKKKKEAVDKKKTEEEAKKKAQEEAAKKAVEKKPEEGKEEKKEPEKVEKPEKEETKEEAKEKKEKKEAVKEAGLKQAKAQAKQARHITTGKKQPTVQRKALAK